MCVCRKRGFAIHYSAASAHSSPSCAVIFGAQLNGRCKAIQDLESFNQPPSHYTLAPLSSFFSLFPWTLLIYPPPLYPQYNRLIRSRQHCLHMNTDILFQITIGQHFFLLKRLDSNALKYAHDASVS